MKTVSKTFFGYTDEEKWLNAQGAKCLRLESAADGRYSFSESSSPVEYRIDCTPDSPFTEKNSAYIQSRLDEGYELAAINGRTLYFINQSGIPDNSQRYRHMMKHIFWVLVSCFSVLAFTLSLLLYEIAQSKALANANFKSITPQTVAYILVLPAAISLGLGILYAFEQFALLRRKKEALSLERIESAEADQSGDGV